MASVSKIRLVGDTLMAYWDNGKTSYCLPLNGDSWRVTGVATNPDWPGPGGNPGGSWGQVTAEMVEVAVAAGGASPANRRILYARSTSVFSWGMCPGDGLVSNIYGIWCWWRIVCPVCWSRVYPIDVAIELCRIHPVS